MLTFYFSINQAMNTSMSLGDVNFTSAVPTSLASAAPSAVPEAVPVMNLNEILSTVLTGLTGILVLVIAAVRRYIKKRAEDIIDDIADDDEEGKEAKCGVDAHGVVIQGVVTPTSLSSTTNITCCRASCCSEVEGVSSETSKGLTPVPQSETPLTPSEKLAATANRVVNYVREKRALEGAFFNE